MKLILLKEKKTKNSKFVDEEKVVLCRWRMSHQTGFLTVRHAAMSSRVECELGEIAEIRGKEGWGLGHENYPEEHSCRSQTHCAPFKCSSLFF